MDDKGRKKTLGKIELKKIEKKSNLQVTFTKRRTGLFRKTSELSILCGAEIAILVQSPGEKILAFGHPSVETLIGRFRSAGAVFSPEAPTSSSHWQQIILHEDGRSKYEEAVRKLEMEKNKTKEEIGSSWWEQPFDCMELHELEGFAEALERLRDNVSRRAEEMEKLQLDAWFEKLLQ